MGGLDRVRSGLLNAALVLQGADAVELNVSPVLQARQA